jgi:hypothetical protein
VLFRVLGVDHHARFTLQRLGQFEALKDLARGEFGSRLRHLLSLCWHRGKLNLLEWIPVIQDPEPAGVIAGHSDRRTYPLTFGYNHFACLARQEDGRLVAVDDPDKPGLLYFDTIAVGEQVLRVVYQGPPLVSAMVFEGLWLLLR